MGPTEWLLLFVIVAAAIVVAAPFLFLYLWWTNREVAQVTPEYLESKQSELSAIDNEILEINDEGDHEGVRRRQDGYFNERNYKGQDLNARWLALESQKEAMINEVSEYWSARGKASSASKALIAFVVILSGTLFFSLAGGSLKGLSQSFGSFLAGMTVICFPASVVSGIVFGGFYFLNAWREPPLLSASTEAEET